MPGVQTTGDFYQEILRYADKNQLQNVKKVMPFARECAYVKETGGLGAPYFSHALEVAWLLIELKLPITREQEDVMLSGAICHILPEVIKDFDYGTELKKIGVIDDIADLITLITRGDGASENDNDIFHDKIKQNPLAYMIRIVDRSNLVQQLCMTSVLQARGYIQETRKYYFPMCIEGRELFPEFAMQISIIMEKLKAVLQAVEILYNQYEAEINGLSEEILNLKEDNARLKGAIKSLKEDCI